jgi:surface antigen
MQNFLEIRLMNKTLIHIALLSAMIGLVGCASNTQGQNTGIGVATGAVAGGLAGAAIGGGTPLGIGVGAVVGGVVGGAIGSSMDSTDSAATYSSLKNTPTNTPTRWTNTKTGAIYTVVPVSGMITINGNPNCRNYRTSVMSNGKSHKIYGTACMQSDGTWKDVAVR